MWCKYSISQPYKFDEILDLANFLCCHILVVTVEITEYGEIIEIGIEATEDFQPEESEQYDMTSICSSSTIIPSWLFEIK